MNIVTVIYLRTLCCKRKSNVKSNESNDAKRMAVTKYTLSVTRRTDKIDYRFVCNVKDVLYINDRLNIRKYIKFDEML